MKLVVEAPRWGSGGGWVSCSRWGKGILAFGPGDVTTVQGLPEMGQGCLLLGRGGAKLTIQ